MKQQYLHFNFQKPTLDLIEFLDGLIDSYLAQGFTLSVRQLYYQLVARGKVENTEKSYKRVASIINDARLAGLLDWDAIEDRGRDVVMRNRYTSGKDVLGIAERSYHMDMWKGQNQRVFVIVEKAALAGVLGGSCHKWDVPLLAARGYPSVSILREMTLSHFAPSFAVRQQPIILHMGDHDPSGIDMTRDLQERIDMFAERGVRLKRIALTMAQIEETSPPPNPAKTTDARFKQYEAEHGDESWELDALEPSYLVRLVEKHIKQAVDMVKWQARKQEIEYIRAKLKTVHDDFED